MFSFRYLLFLPLLVLIANVSAQVVECVDANGKKTYAQSCPDSAEKKRDIQAQPKLGGSKPVDDSWKDKERDFEKRRQERLSGTAKDSAQQGKDDQADKRCADAKLRLDALNSGKQSKRVDPVTGDHVPMDDNARQVEIDQLNKDIQSSCQ